AVVHNPKSAFDRAGEPILFHWAGTFPSITDPEFEVSDDARNVYKAGELPVLLRGLASLSGRTGLPFWVAAFAHQHGTQTLLLLIPLLSVLLPLVRILPALYNWSVRRRLLHWYRQLKALEAGLGSQSSARIRQEIHEELDLIERQVSRVRVPLA